MERKYIQFIKDLKHDIIKSRYIAARLANKKQLLLYLQTGKMLADKIEKERWGMKVIENITTGLQNELPGLRGFSYRNLMKMHEFYSEYQSTSFLLDTATENSSNKILPSATAEFKASNPSAFFGVGFSHHILLINKCKSIKERLFYMNLAASQFWTVADLELQINSSLYKHQGKLASNFKNTLPKNLNASAIEVFRDEHLFDFVCPEDEKNERVFETELVRNIKNAVMTLGKGFSFIANQFRIEIGGQEFFIDLLFYNRYLQSLVVFELKRGAFKPEYAGQLNFYLNVLDDKIKLPHENPSIGIILCKEKNNTVVEFAFKNINKALGVATFKTSKEVPKEMKGTIPDANDLAQLL